MLGFESGKGFDLLNSENAMRRSSVKRSVERFFCIMSEVCTPKIYFSQHINIVLTTMKCKSH